MYGGRSAGAARARYALGLELTQQVRSAARRSRRAALTQSATIRPPTDAGEFAQEHGEAGQQHAPIKMPLESSLQRAGEEGEKEKGVA